LSDNLWGYLSVSHDFPPLATIRETRIIERWIEFHGGGSAGGCNALKSLACSAILHPSPLLVADAIPREGVRSPVRAAEYFP